MLGVINPKGSIKDRKRDIKFTFYRQRRSIVGRRGKSQAGGKVRGGKTRGTLAACAEGRGGGGRSSMIRKKRHLKGDEVWVCAVGGGIWACAKGARK